MQKVLSILVELPTYCTFNIVTITVTITIITELINGSSLEI